MKLLSDFMINLVAQRITESKKSRPVHLFIKGRTPHDQHLEELAKIFDSTPKNSLPEISEIIREIGNSYYNRLLRTIISYNIVWSSTPEGERFWSAFASTLIPPVEHNEVWMYGGITESDYLELTLSGAFNDSIS